MTDSLDMEDAENVTDLVLPILKMMEGRQRSTVTATMAHIVAIELAKHPEAERDELLDLFVTFVQKITPIFAGESPLPDSAGKK